VAQSIRHRQLTSLPAADLFNVDQWVGDFYITRNRKLAGAIELSGIDPAALGFADHLKLSRIIDSIFTNITPSVSVTQYQMNSRAGGFRLRPRPDPFQHRISQERESFLGSKTFIQTRLIHFFEIDLDDSYNSLNPIMLASNLIGSLYSSRKRKELFHSLSASQQLLLSRRDINEKSDILSGAISNALARWQALCESWSLDRAGVHEILAFLASFGSETPSCERLQELPIGQYLASGDIKTVVSAGQPTIKFDGPEPVYARVGSVVSFGNKGLPGFWAHEAGSPALLNIECVLMYRWTRLSMTQASMLFELKRKELERQTLNVASLISTKGEGHLSKKLQDQFAELDNAGAMKVSWYRSESYILAYSLDSHALKRQVLKLHASITSSGAKIVWEDSNLMNAFRAFYPTGSGKGARRLIANNPQNAANAICYKSSIGIPVVEATKEEALCIFQSPTGSPFHYYPSVGGKGLVLGIGPTRTGKSYFKNTVALHSLKYGGIYYALDVDPGTEPLAQLLGVDGSIFRVYDEGGLGGGFNLFASCKGAKDQRFKTHFMQQIKRMVSTNMDERSRSLTIEEQQELDVALEATLNLPVEMRTFSHFFSHLNKELGNKLSRWVRGDAGQRRADGLYSQLTDSVVDSMGGVGRFKVFNFENLKKDEDQRSVAYAEVFHRIIQDFESPALRAVPKFLDIDEAHIPLQDIEFQQWITQGIVTWNKYNVFPSLWTQSVEEMLKLQRFEAIRSAAGTMLFTADSDLNEGLYQRSLGLTLGECHAIKNLIPRKQIYIIQRDIGVSKAIEISNDKFTDIVVSSTPTVVAIRDPLVAAFGIEEGIQRTIVQLST